MKERLFKKWPILFILFFFDAFSLFPIVPLKHVQETHILLIIDILSVDDLGMEELASFHAEIPTEKRGFLAKAIELKGKNSSETIGLEIEVIAKEKGELRIWMDVQSIVTPLNGEVGKKYRREEKFEILENSSHLMEIFQSFKTKKKVILNITAQKKRIDTFQVSYPSTTKVRFHLNIYRISKGDDILLEKNSLSTVLHQTASYYLHLFPGEKKGQKGHLSNEELNISMIPLSISDERIDLEVEIEGTILSPQREDIPVHIKKVENVANAESFSISVASEKAGEETQEGYKFEVIPFF